MKIMNLEVLVMPNGEIISAGKSLGFKDSVCGQAWNGEDQTLGDFLSDKEDNK